MRIAVVAALSFLLVGCYSATVKPEAEANPIIGPIEQARLVQCESMKQFASGSWTPEQFVELCRVYFAQTCGSDNECGGFPCYSGTCLIKPCLGDTDCPSLCGLNAAPTPGFCTSVDVT